MPFFGMIVVIPVWHVGARGTGHGAWGMGWVNGTRASTHEDVLGFQDTPAQALECRQLMCRHGSNNIPANGCHALAELHPSGNGSRRLESMP